MNKQEVIDYNFNEGFNNFILLNQIQSIRLHMIEARVTGNEYHFTVVLSELSQMAINLMRAMEKHEANEKKKKNKQKIQADQISWTQQVRTGIDEARDALDDYKRIGHSRFGTRKKTLMMSKKLRIAGDKIEKLQYIMMSKVDDLGLIFRRTERDNRLSIYQT